MRVESAPLIPRHPYNSPRRSFRLDSAATAAPSPDTPPPTRLVPRTLAVAAARRPALLVRPLSRLHKPVDVTAVRSDEGDSTVFEAREDRAAYLMHGAEVPLAAESRACAPPTSPEAACARTPLCHLLSDRPPPSQVEYPAVACTSRVHTDLLAGLQALASEREAHATERQELTSIKYDLETARYRLGAHEAWQAGQFAASAKQAERPPGASSPGGRLDSCIERAAECAAQLCSPEKLARAADAVADSAGAAAVAACATACVALLVRIAECL